MTTASKPPEPARELCQVHVAELRDGVEVSVRRGQAFRTTKFKNWRAALAAISAAVEGIGQ